MDEFLQDLDEDVEGMQSTIYLLQNELQKCKASIQHTNSTENKEIDPKAVINGIKKENVSNTDTTLISKTETPVHLVETKVVNKHDKPKDPKHLKDCKSNQPKEKKPRPAITEGKDQSTKNSKVHKSRHKSDTSKKEEKHIKSEKRAHSKDEVLLKKSKSDQSKSPEVTPVAAINGLINGS